MYKYGVLDIMNVIGQIDVGGEAIKWTDRVFSEYGLAMAFILIICALFIWMYIMEKKGRNKDNEAMREIFQ